MITTRVTFIPWRFYFVLILLTTIVICLLVRVFDLTIWNQHFLRTQGDERVLRLVNSPAFRGNIIDRNGYPLAVSTSVYSVWINPQTFSPSKRELKNLSSILNLDVKDMLQERNQYLKKKREFMYLKRGLSPNIAKHIKSYAIPGLFLKEEYRRYYPEGENAGNLIGVTNIDDQGQEGLELAYNQWLSGETGKKWVIRDRLGQVISDVETIKEQKPGNDLTLSIDRRIQYLAYRELSLSALAFGAQSATAIVLDVKTGEILAMANFPSFNPNARPFKFTESLKNRAITDLFEPGSTIKAFSIASALETGLYTPNTIVETSPGWMMFGKNRVHDERNYGKMTIAKILQLSSNIGVTKVILNLPSNQLWQFLHKLGFGEVTGVGFPGEQGGLLEQRYPWQPFTLATLGFGYGLSVTALQLVRAYAVLANDGIKLPVTLLKVEKEPKGEQTVDIKVAHEMLHLLELVVKEGTGKKAIVPGYRVAGKTGTAKKVGERGYEEHHYTASFVGIAPVSQPRVAVAVVMHDPQGKYYLGADVAGPVFAKIMEGSLRILDVPPDA